jgi:hypothetical protein
MHACASLRPENMQRSVHARSAHTRRHARMHASPTTALTSTYMYACASTRPPTCKQAFLQGWHTHADTHACTRHQALFQQSCTCTRVNIGDSQARSERTSRHARMHASPTTAHESMYMHASGSRRDPTCKEAYKQGLHTHADMHACTRDQPCSDNHVHARICVHAVLT